MKSPTTTSGVDSLNVGIVLGEISKHDQPNLDF